MACKHWQEGPTDEPPAAFSSDGLIGNRAGARCAASCARRSRSRGWRVASGERCALRFETQPPTTSGQSPLATRSTHRDDRASSLGPKKGPRPRFCARRCVDQGGAWELGGPRTKPLLGLGTWVGVVGTGARWPVGLIKTTDARRFLALVRELGLVIGDQCPAGDLPHAAC
jgi:hypothetical protein